MMNQVLHVREVLKEVLGKTLNSLFSRSTILGSLLQKSCTWFFKRVSAIAGTK